MATTRKQLSKYRAKRNFRVTREPAGSEPARAPHKSAKRVRKKLTFVIQKHAARQLHFDLRLELDGVMKSWAVPKGPSLDPAAKRLAMQVEDHPMEYNRFEGTIPEGEYGGGTVMIWDQGHYTAEHADEHAGDQQAAVRAGLQAGQLKFILRGERLKGSFVLVRTRTGRGKPQWLLIKHRDADAQRGSDVVAKYDTSVVSDRTMQEIADHPDRVWRSVRQQTAKRTKRTGKRSGKRVVRRKTSSKRVVGARGKLDLKSVSPMLATSGSDLPEGADWTFEPKYDGVRVLAFVTPGDVRLITRNAKDKTRQFPEIVAGLRNVAGRNGRSLVLDGEIVALAQDEPARFQKLQGRTHVTDAHTIERLTGEAPAALFVFDMLVDGPEVLMGEPWSERRARLEQRMARKRESTVRLGATSADPADMLEQAQSQGWEGVMAKRVAAPYRPGQRTRDWLKLKIEQRQEFVVGGYTEPRRTREHLGALLLGYYDDAGQLVYAGHTGSGFTRASLRELHKRLNRLPRKTSPFTTVPRTNEAAHWVRPQLVVEIRFNEWTRQGKLRQPIFVGMRDDKDPAHVKREERS